MREAASLWLLLAAGCVFPATDPTGIELSWRFVEQGPEEDIDTEGGPQVRSCTGALAEQIAVSIADVDEPQRHGIFRFDCTEGFQTTVEFQIAASDAFVRLDPGPYTVELFAVDDASNAIDSELVETREVEVDDQTITVETWAIQRQPVDWRLELSGMEACDALTLGVHYANPETDLADFAPPDEGILTPYRAGLVSDRGLVLGEATPCADELGGAHRFEGLDRGEYLLTIDLDGTVCTVVLDLRARAEGSSVIDLANLPCGG